MVVVPGESGYGESYQGETEHGQGKDFGQRARQGSGA